MIFLAIVLPGVIIVAAICACYLMQSGEFAAPKLVMCPRCFGHGVEPEYITRSQHDPYVPPCTRCEGTGEVEE